MYLGLFTSKRDGLIGSEIATAGYRRQPVRMQNGSNVETVTFPVALENWPTVVALGIFASEDDTVPLQKGFLDRSVTINARDLAQFSPGTILIRGSD